MIQPKKAVRLNVLILFAEIKLISSVTPAFINLVSSFLMYNIFAPAPSYKDNMFVFNFI